MILDKKFYGKSHFKGLHVFICINEQLCNFLPVVYIFIKFVIQAGKKSNDVMSEQWCLGKRAFWVAQVLPAILSVIFFNPFNVLLNNVKVLKVMN